MLLTPAQNDRVQRTLLIVNPDALSFKSDIYQTVEDEGLTICQEKEEVISREDIECLLQGEMDALHFPRLVKSLTSGPSAIVEIGGLNAIAILKEHAGPPSVAVARKIAPSTFRGKYGTSAIKNAVHVSLSHRDSLRERQIFFPRGVTTGAGRGAVRSTVHYLSETVLPAVNSCLGQLCRIRPTHPHEFVSKWFSLHKPIHESVTEVQVCQSMYNPARDALKAVSHYR